KLIMNEHQYARNDESKSEWVISASTHGQSKSSSQQTILPSECKHSFYNTIRAQLRQITIYGFTKARYTISTNQINQMSLFFNPSVPDHISICFNEMKYEIIIPYEEICKIEIINFGKLYYYREINHPWMLKRILLYSDPTDGYLDEAISFCLRPLNSVDYYYAQNVKTEINKLSRMKWKNLPKQIGIFHSPKVMIGHKNGTCTQVTIQSSGTITTPSELKLNEVYVTCIFATEKRAIFYPVNGTFYHLRLFISRRFQNKQWNKTWFRNSRGIWIKLKNESDWNLAKSESQCGKMERVIVYFK
ncbi:13607_t:CDS:2, partial [Dentiscutata heterogama]